MWFCNNLVENIDIENSTNLLTTDIYKLSNLVYHPIEFLEINECLQKNRKKKFRKMKPKYGKIHYVLRIWKVLWIMLNTHE